MTATLQVRCLKLKEKEVVADKQRTLDKSRTEKSDFGDKFPEKPTIDKRTGFDKGFDNKLGEGRPGGFGFGGSGAGSQRRGRQPSPVVVAFEALLARLERLEAIVEREGDPSGMGEGQQSPFIGQELRPDLSQGALAEEDDHAQLRQGMMTGSATAKRLYDGKPGG